MDKLPEIRLYRDYQGKFVASVDGESYFYVQPPKDDCGCCDLVWYFTADFAPVEVWRSGPES